MKHKQIGQVMIFLMLVYLLGVGQAISQAAALNTIQVADGLVAVSADGECSLLEAVANATDTTDGVVYNDCSAGDPNNEDSVQLAANGSYLFANAATFINLTSLLTIEGNGATLDHNAYAFFTISGSNARLTLHDLTLTGSYGTASAISGSGSLRMYNSTLRDNVNTDTGGGAITLASTLNSQHLFDNVTFENNVGDQFGGAIRFTTSNAPSLMEIHNTTFRSNGTSTVAPTGMYTDFGGAISVSSTSADRLATITISNSTFEDNLAQSGGALRISDNSIVTITHTTLNDNRAFSGGGAIVVTDGQLDITASTISNNRAVHTTGIGYGGGIANSRGRVSLFNSTLSENSADIGGAISNRSTYTSDNDSLVDLDFVTIAMNEATSGSGGAIHNYAVNNSVSRVLLRNNFIVGNTGATQGSFSCHNDGGSFLSYGYNARTGSALGGCFFTLDDSNKPDIYVGGSLVEDIVTTLANNGGNTLTHAIPTTSDAYNVIPNGVNGCDSAAFDQRDLQRQSGTAGTTCDAGAYEHGASAPPTAVTLSDQRLVSGQPHVWGSIVLFVLSIIIVWRLRPKI